MANSHAIDPTLAAEDYCYVTTTGRVTGKPHRIEIWFALQEDTLYILAGGGRRSDWVRNALKQPRVDVRIADRRFDGTARIVEDRDEDALARRLLLEKYAKSDSDLDEWGRTALPVAIDFTPSRRRIVTDDDLRDRVIEALGGLPVRSRSLFGGYGLYLGDTFFGVISDRKLYFRTDDASRPAYVQRGMPPLQPRQRPRGPKTVDRNFQVPQAIVEDIDALREWALRAASTKD